MDSSWEWVETRRGAFLLGTLDDGNPLSLLRGQSRVLQHIWEIVVATYRPPRVKLLLTGDSGVGKTSLWLRFKEMRTAGNTTEIELATIGHLFAQNIVRVGGVAAEVQLWDSPGHERYKTLQRSYYRGAHGVVACFDTTDELSFAHMPQWLEDAQSGQGANGKQVLVGTKIDLAHKRQVEVARAEELARGSGLAYFETSGKSGIGCASPIDHLVKLVLQDYGYLPSVTEPADEPATSRGRCVCS